MKRKKRTIFAALLLIGILSIQLIGCDGGAASGGSASSQSNEAVQQTSDGTEAEGTETPGVDGETVAEADNPAPGDAENTQKEAEKLPYQTAGYIQDESVIADTDQYKLTVAGYDPEYAQDDLQGFLIRLRMENKTEKEYVYMITESAVNHVSLYGRSLEGSTTIPAGGSAEMEYLLSTDSLISYQIESVDAVHLCVQASSSEYMEVSDQLSMNMDSKLIEKMGALRDTDVSVTNYTFSPTGKDYEEVPPAVTITEEGYAIVVDNDVLTFGFKKNEDGSILSEDGIIAGLVVHTDGTEGISVQADDIVIDGNDIYYTDPTGQIAEVRYTVHFPSARVSNVVLPKQYFIDREDLEANSVSDPSTIEFKLNIFRGEDDSISEPLFEETVTYDFK